MVGTYRTQAYLLGTSFANNQGAGGMTASDFQDLTVSTLGGSALPTFMPEMYGAVGNGSTDDTAAWNAMIAAMYAAGGGTAFCGHSQYGISGTGIKLNTTTVPNIHLVGYGVTLQALSNGTTVLQIDNQTNNLAPSTVSGFLINGNSHTTTIGLQCRDTCNAIIHGVNIENCTTGLQLQNFAANNYNESNSFYDMFITACTTGIDMQIVSGTNSVNQCSFYNVGVNDCTTGLLMETGINVARLTFKNLTIWVYDNQTAISMQSLFFENMRMEVNIECFGTTGTVGVANSGTFGYGAGNGLTNDLVITFADNNPLVTPFSGPNPIFYRNGGTGQFYGVVDTPVVSVQLQGESDPRLQMQALQNGTLTFGNGSGTNFDLACAFGTSNMKWPGALWLGGGLGVGNSATASALGTLSRKMQVFSATGASLGFIPIYTTIT